MPPTPPPAPPGRLRLLAAAMIAGALLGGCSGGSSSSPTTSATSAGATPAVSASGFAGAALPDARTAPGFTLTDQRGRRVSLASYRGQVAVLAFLQRTCGACMLVAQQIRGALDQLARPAPVLIVSAEPAADTSAGVKRFLARVALSGRAEYLSGSRRELQGVWRSYRVTPPSAGRGAFERAVTVRLIDREGRERVVFGLEQLTPESLAHDIGKLQEG